MLTREALMSWMMGTGIAIKARQRWQSLPLGENLRFADDRTIAELRAEHTEWRAQSLAPVSIIDDVSSLPSLSDTSLDYIVAYHLLMDEDRIHQALDTAARLLRPGGTLLIPVAISDAGPDVRAISRGLQRVELQEDSKLHDSPCDNERWSCDRVAIAMGRLAMSKRATFDLEAVSAVSYTKINRDLQLWRNGVDYLIVFRRKNDKCLETGSLIDVDATIYVVDGLIIRHVPTLQILDRIRMGKPIYYLNKREFSSLDVGSPLVEGDVNTLISKLISCR
jgi:predicted SAM-dependent methyltransferase